MKVHQGSPKKNECLAIVNQVLGQPPKIANILHIFLGSVHKSEILPRSLPQRSICYVCVLICINDLMHQSIVIPFLPVGSWLPRMSSNPLGTLEFCSRDVVPLPPSLCPPSVSTTSRGDSATSFPGRRPFSRENPCFFE